MVTAASIDEGGNLNVGQVAAVTATDAEGNVAGVVKQTAATVDPEGNAAVASTTSAGVAPVGDAEAIEASSSDDGDTKDHDSSS
jgi:hypothetical protein